VKSIITDILKEVNRLEMVDEGVKSQPTTGETPIK
jgi:hypothetical protein